MGEIIQLLVFNNHDNIIIFLIHILPFEQTISMFKILNSIMLKGP